MGEPSCVMCVNPRKERIEYLLNELRYEITRGLMMREIEPQFVDRFVVPMPGPMGAVFCEFRSYPVGQGGVPPFVETKRYLRLVKTTGDRT